MTTPKERHLFLYKFNAYSSASIKNSLQNEYTRVEGAANAA
jgi:hypothetical protein